MNEIWSILEYSIMRPILCFFGFHKNNWHSFGNLVNGEMTFHCIYCEKPIWKVPIDDVPEEELPHIRFVLSMKRTTKTK